MSEYETILNKINLIDEKLELYKKVGEDYRASSKEQVDSIRAEIKAYQDANKQQLNVSLGVLVTSAIAVLVSAVIGTR